MAIKLTSSRCLGIGRGVSNGCIGGSDGSRGVSSKGVSSKGISRKGISSKGISLPQLSFLVEIGLLFGKQWALVWHWPQPQR